MVGIVFSSLRFLALCLSQYHQLGTLALRGGRKFQIPRWCLVAGSLVCGVCVQAFLLPVGITGYLRGQAVHW